jgi:hypothetical protein
VEAAAQSGDRSEGCSQRSGRHPVVLSARLLFIVG